MDSMKKKEATQRNTGTEEAGTKKIAKPIGNKAKKERGKSVPVFLPGKSKRRSKATLAFQTGPDKDSQPENPKMKVQIPVITPKQTGSKAAETRFNKRGRNNKIPKPPEASRQEYLSPGRESIKKPDVYKSGYSPTLKPVPAWLAQPWMPGSR